MDEAQSKSVKKGLTYEEAGVSIATADEAIKRIGEIVRRTATTRVLEGVGPFGASFYARFEDMEEPVLVASTDGVGTKVKLSARFKAFRNIGYDLVAVSANDIITTAATPLFFLDYIACNKVEPSVVSELVEGMADGCLECGSALIGGELAEMRDVYAEGEFDLAGFMVGVVEKRKLLTGETIKEGDVIVALPSVGVHANGYTLVRKILAGLRDEQWEAYNPRLGKSLKEELLTPTKMYFKEVKALQDSEVEVKGIAHISGGGIPANLKRVLPLGVDAVIEISKIETPPIFHILREMGEIDMSEMWRVFNMGVGLIIILSQEQADNAFACAEEYGFTLYQIGSITEGNSTVRLI